MSQNVVIVTLIVVKLASSAPSPLQVTIDCSSDENRSSMSAEFSRSNPSFDVDSFCGLIQNAIPKAIEDGKFIVVEPNLKTLKTDQVSDSNTPIRAAVAPPNDFIPKTFPKPKIPRFKTPRVYVPKLKARGSLRAPKLGDAMPFVTLRKILEEESSAERMERFKSGVQKMLHFVKVLGQIDQYVSERTRFVIDKLSKTFMD